MSKTMELAQKNGVEFLSEITTFGDRFVVKFRFNIESARLNRREFGSMELAEQFRDGMSENLV